MALKNLEDINTTFSEIKRVGMNAEYLANSVMDIYTRSKNTTKYFEDNAKPDSDFIKNFYAFGGEARVAYAQKVYMILKEMEAKLEALDNA